jgi:hypothetical protein
MPAIDVEVPLVGITPRKHVVSRNQISKRAKYPFKGMIINDYFTVENEKEARSVREALKSFYRRIPHRRFTVRQNATGDLWICRRVL